MRNKNKHSLRGVSIHHRKGDGTLVRSRALVTPLDRASLVKAHPNLDGLSTNFNSLPQHEKLREIKECGVRFTPRYT